MSDFDDPAYSLGTSGGILSHIGLKSDLTRDAKREAQAKYAAEIKAAADQSARLKAIQLDSRNKHTEDVLPPYVQTSSPMKDSETDLYQKRIQQVFYYFTVL